MKFLYRGTIPASKSIMNRALICSSYGKGLKLKGQSSCDDVQKMMMAVEQLELLRHSTEPAQSLSSSEAPRVGAPVYDCGAAGTVLRFLSLRLSRIPGVHVLKGTERLMQRPQQDLLQLFDRLGVRYETDPEHLTLHSNGWQNLEEPITVQREVSSQFASGLILNAWDLPTDLNLQMIGEPMSEGYLDMTLKVVEKLGMKITRTTDQLTIKAQSQVATGHYQVESDLSSLFAVAAFAVLNGEAQFENFPEPSLQPDSEFLNFFRRMGIPTTMNHDTLEIKSTAGFQGVEANLKSCPDLFPVLAVLCSFALTPSRLYGAPQLIHKESNRIAKTSELLNLIGVKNETQSDGMIIHPRTTSSASNHKFQYDTDHDHRLAFAAALVKSQGYPITILHPEVVNKSFPEFWQVIQLSPN